jgi:hypothetical protein
MNDNMTFCNVIYDVVKEERASDVLSPSGSGRSCTPQRTNLIACMGF